MDTFELITKLRTTLHKNLQTIGDSLMDGVDNMEKYQYMLGQIRTYQYLLQEISALLKTKEQNENEGTVISIKPKDSPTK